ncbi:MAG: SDR family NAD(P)-dependent oxidoreductase [Chlorobiaceae bacterium]|nr:SDR family NAD(P)-dependent oxidoreductase [Chlorobiaceae bacterium]
MKPPFHTLVTGASMGIGSRIAEDFASKGESLVLVARSRDRLEGIAATLSARHGVEVMVCSEDLGEAGGPGRVFEFCRARGISVDRLVNCAGFSVAGSFLRIAPEELHQMAMVNMVSLAEMVRLFLPGMIARGRGTVVNIASLASFQGVPGMGLYSATKSFVRILTEAINEEVRGSGVRVFAVCPGFIDNDQFYNRSGHDRKRIMVPISAPGVVVRAIRRGLDSGAAVVMPTLFDRLMVFTQRLMPRRVVVMLAGFFAGAGEKKSP